MTRIIAGWQVVRGRFASAPFRTLLPYAGIVAALAMPALMLALDAPSPPGNPSVWGPGAKDFLGTSVTGTSRVYFTGAEGILGEVFYPTLDKVQNVDMQLLVTDATRTWGAEERRQAMHDVTLVEKRALLWQAVTTADDKRWKITRRVFTDPNRDSIIQRITFETLEPGKTVKDYNLYVLSNPAINNSGAGDDSRTLATTKRTMLVASEAGSVASALAVSLPWKTANGKAMVSNGFVGRNDGWSDLFGGASDKTMDWTFDASLNGNVAQLGWIDLGGGNGSTIAFDVVLSFGATGNDAMATADATLDSDLAKVEAEYVAGWVKYCGGLSNQGGSADDPYYLAAMTLKTVQDKSNGAMIAGAGTPWGDSYGDDNRGGYHLVWARDLYKFASALLAAGDTDSTAKAVGYLFNVQMQTVRQDAPAYSRPGRFPQNSWVDGTPFWNATQMDESAMPIILAWRLHQVQPLDLKALWPRIKMAAEFVASTGPRTDQDRWEEMSGYSPSTIAAEIAGMVCAADLAKAAGDAGAAAFYLKKADEWRNNVANWTFTTTGFHGNGKYYLRINANQDPNDDVQLAFGNNAGTHGERYILDGGFLELVRLGTMSPSDWTILETLPEYDSILKQTIPGKGDAFFRYNYDGYGERNDGGSYDNRNGRGRLWPIFTAERGIYEIARAGDGKAGLPYRDTLRAFSSPAGFIPEQVWNVSATITGWETTTPAGVTPGTATRSMRPLNWAMGEYMNLIVAMQRGRGDAPAVVTQRYATDQPQVTVTFTVNATTQFGQNIYLVGDHPLLSACVPEAGIKLAPTAYPVWSGTVSLPASTALQYKYVRRSEQGMAEWEGGANRSFTTPASGAVTRTDAFQ